MSKNQKGLVHPVLIICALLIGIVGLIFLIFRTSPGTGLKTSPGVDLNVFETKDECEAQTEMKCIYYLCDIPLGEHYENICMNGPGTGWYGKVVFVKPEPSIAPKVTGVDEEGVSSLPSGLEIDCESSSDCQNIVSHNNCRLYCTNNNISNQYIIDSTNKTCDSTLWDPPLSQNCSCVSNKCVNTCSFENTDCPEGLRCILVDALPGSSGICSNEIPEPEKSCLERGGNWLQDRAECEDISKSDCAMLGGEFNECASSCRHVVLGPNMGACSQQCIQVCHF